MQLRGRLWALILGEPRTRGGDDGRILEPEVLHEVVDTFLLRKRYGVGIAIARHPYPGVQRMSPSPVIVYFWLNTDATRSSC